MVSTFTIRIAVALPPPHAAGIAHVYVIVYLPAAVSWDSPTTEGTVSVLLRQSSTQIAPGSFQP